MLATEGLTCIARLENRFRSCELCVVVVGAPLLGELEADSIESLWHKSRNLVCELLMMYFLVTQVLDGVSFLFEVTK